MLCCKHKDRNVSHAIRGKILGKMKSFVLTTSSLVPQVIFPFLTALDYLHSRYIIHRDIKVSQIVL